MEKLLPFFVRQSLETCTNLESYLTVVSNVSSCPGSYSSIHSAVKYLWQFLSPNSIFNEELIRPTEWSFNVTFTSIKRPILSK